MTDVRGVSASRGSHLVPMPTRAAGPVLLAPFSTRLPPELLRRLRVAAPQLEQRIGETAAAALDVYLRERGF